MRRVTKRTIVAVLITTLCGCGGSIEAISNQFESLASKFLGTTTVSNTVPLPGNRSQYSIMKVQNGYMVTDSSGNINTYTNLTAFKFDDITVNLLIPEKAQSVSPSDLQILIELYIAFFNRVPDADGLAYWIDQFKAGQSIESIANSFYQAAIQYSSLTGYTSSMTNQDFIKTIYKNVLGRTSVDTEGLTYWTNALANGNETRGSLVKTILYSAHTFKGNITYGYVADLLDNKVKLANYFTILQGINYNSPENSITATMNLVADVTPTSADIAINKIKYSTQIAKTLIGSNVNYRGIRTVTQTFSDGSVDTIQFNANKEIVSSKDKNGAVTTSTIEAIKSQKQYLSDRITYQISYTFPDYQFSNQITATDLSSFIVNSSPVNIDEIKYPSSYLTIGSNIDQTPELTCDYSKQNLVFPSDYIGRFQLPTLSQRTLPSSVIRGINLSDSWGEMNVGCAGHSELASLKTTFERLKKLGAEYADMVPWGVFQITNDKWDILVAGQYDPNLMTQADFATANSIASNSGIKLFWRNQIQIGWDPKVENYFSVEPTLSNAQKFLTAYETFLIDKAKFLQSIGAGGMHVTCDCWIDLNSSPAIMDANLNFYKRVLPQLRSSFSGKLTLKYEPGFENVPEIVNNIDMFRFSLRLPMDAIGYSVQSVKDSSIEHMRQTILNAKVSGKPFIFEIGAPSRIFSDNPRFFEEGSCSTAASNESYATPDCIQRSIKPDFSYQAIFYEGALQAVADQNFVTLGGVMAMGYHHVDQILPTNWFPQIAWSTRNKPAESIIKSWYKK